MKDTILSAPPNFVLEQLKKFEEGFTGKSWRELYDAVHYLKLKYPDKIFSGAPFIYVDITNNTSGLIFIDSESEDLIYVHK